MIELRWLVKDNTLPENIVEIHVAGRAKETICLQYRETDITRAWSDWKDVLEVKDD